jgi:hypothetical protein
MGCGCKPVVINTAPLCDKNCIRISTTRIGCDDGPSCGEVVVTDLSEFVVGPPGSTLTYSLNKETYEGFTSVTLTAGGELTFEKDSQFVANKEYVISYKVKQDGGILSDIGYIYICTKDLCKGVFVPDGEICNPCDGTFSSVLPNLIIG